MRKVILYSVVVAFACLSSCSDEYVEAERVIPLTSFTTLDIDDVFSIYLVQDTFYGVDIVGDVDGIADIQATVQNNVLHLVDNNKRKWMHPESNKIKVYVHSPNHGDINANAAYALYSVNTITSDLSIVNGAEVRYSEIDLTLDNNSFSYWNNYSCGGKLTLRGQSESFDINNYALHAVNAADLQAQTGLIRTYAKADCIVRVSGQLTLSLHGEGNIYVHGNPVEVIVAEHTSTGKVIRVE